MLLRTHGMALLEDSEWSGRTRAILFFFIFLYRGGRPGEVKDIGDRGI